MKDEDEYLTEIRMIELEDPTYDPTGWGRDEFWRRPEIK